MKLKAGIMVLLLVALGLACLSAFTVGEGEFAIVTEFGKPVRTIREAGLYLKKPGFLQTVIPIDKRHNVFKSQPMELLLKDKNPIVISCFVCWRVSDPEQFIRSLTTVKNTEIKLGDMTNDQLGSILGEYTRDNIINTEAGIVKLVEIEKRIHDNLNRKTRDEYGIEVVRTGIRRLNYTSIVESSVFNRMRAERDKEARKYRAEGKQQATVIEAQADREVKEIMAEAYRESQVIMGEGDREATRILAEAYGKDSGFFEFLKSLELYRETLQENATLILTTDSPLFRHLNGAEPEIPEKDAESHGN